MQRVRDNMRLVKDWLKGWQVVCPGTPEDRLCRGSILCHPERIAVRGHKFGPVCATFCQRRNAVNICTRLGLPPHLAHIA